MLIICGLVLFQFYSFNQVWTKTTSDFGGITSTKLNTYVNNHRPACFFNRFYLPKCGLQQEVCMLMDLYRDLVEEKTCFVLRKIQGMTGLSYENLQI